MRRLLPLILILCLSIAVPVFADVIVGNPPDPGTGNEFPFGSGYGLGGTAEYQQVYNNNQFSGPITITGLDFYNTQFNSGATSMNTGTWTISLYTTSLNWNSITSSFSFNISQSVGHQVFSGNLFQSWAFGDTLAIALQTPFTYNPANGALLMDVSCTGCSAPGGNIFFDTNGFNGGGFNGNNFLGRVYCSGGSPCGDAGTVNNGYGLVTGFITGNQTVPEPASLVLFGSGILSAAGLLRRKFKK